MNNFTDDLSWLWEHVEISINMNGGPVGPRSDIASKSGFSASLFECNGQLKKFLQSRIKGIQEKLQEIDPI